MKADQRHEPLGFGTDSRDICSLEILMQEYDTLMIGGGQASIPLARSVAQQGASVAIAERQHLGGSCVNFGCTPTKAAIASARVAYLSRRAAEFGVLIDNVGVDFPAVLQRARRIAAESRAGLVKNLEQHAIPALAGHARFTGRAGSMFSLVVGDSHVRAKRVVIDTGARTIVPPIEGLATVDYLHAGNWLEGRSLPEHVIFIGAGYIGVEMAQFYRRMGAEVTVVGRAEQIFSREDADVAAALQAILEEEGISFRLDTAVRNVINEEERVKVTVERDGKRDCIAGSHLFVATGRRPNTDDLGLETIGLRPDEKGVIHANDRLETSVPGVWVAGDVRGGPMFTHASWDDHRVLESQLLSDGSLTTAGRIVPYAIFTDPELGRVGLSEKEARQKYGEHTKIITFAMNHNGKAVEIAETRGLIKLIANSQTLELVGAAVLAVDGAELVGNYITLLNAGATLTALCKSIYIHPTLTEAIQSAALALELPMTTALSRMHR
jgi:pyruvate/2-oxoglutarate dehydrogenase complex dihydrolipoamide dehydrogenase (E3) component